MKFEFEVQADHPECCMVTPERTAPRFDGLAGTKETRPDGVVVHLDTHGTVERLDFSTYKTLATVERVIREETASREFKPCQRERCGCRDYAKSKALS